MRRTDSFEKILMLGKIEGGRRRGRQRREEKGTTEDEMVGWHHWLDGHGFGWTLGVGDGQGGLACCGSWGRKESDTTEQLNWTELIRCEVICFWGYEWYWASFHVRVGCLHDFRKMFIQTLSAHCWIKFLSLFLFVLFLRFFSLFGCGFYYSVV